MLTDENGFPRRSRLDLCEAAEKIIYDAIQEVEKLGADVRLTNAVVKLSEAKELVSDFIDEQKSNEVNTNETTDDSAADDDGGGGNHPTDPSGKP